MCINTLKSIVAQICKFLRTLNLFVYPLTDKFKKCIPPSYHRAVKQYFENSLQFRSYQSIFCHLRIPLPLFVYGNNRFFVVSRVCPNLRNNSHFANLPLFHIFPCVCVPTASCTTKRNVLLCMTVSRTLVQITYSHSRLNSVSDHKNILAKV
jgi:hypothetical protein